MNITFACPKCELAARLDLSPGDGEIVCPHCSQRIRVPSGAFHDGHLDRCLVCPSSDLFIRKDFPQRLGLALVAIGIIGSSIAWSYTNLFWTFAILFATALADFLLYLVVGNTLMCYRCQSEYRQLAGLDEHAPFDLEVHERHRQTKAREQQSSGEQQSKVAASQDSS